MSSPSLVQRASLLTVAPLVLCVALAGCSSSAPGAPSSSGAASSAAQPSDASAASATTSAAQPSAAATETAGSGGGGGTITFKGKVAGKMTVSDCPDGKTAQLTVDVDGQDDTYQGVIDAGDFAFTGPSSTAYSLPAVEPKPKVSGKTFTVQDAKLVSVVNVKDVVIASGSVTCP